MKRLATLLLLLFAPALRAQTFDPFARGDAIALDKAIPANERGILCLAIDDRGRVYGGTTGRAAHLFVHDPATGSVRSLARLPGGVGFAHALLRLPDGSLLGGTQADPTGIAVQTDPKAVGHLYRFIPNGDGPAKVEDLGVPVQGQGICTLAYLEKSSEVVGNTWPDGHFFTYDLKAKKFRDHGAIAGYRTFEQPRHAEDINRGGGRQVRYPRQVSRAIAVDPATGAYTGGADGYLYRYDPAARKVEKLPQLRLPAAPGREPWASLDAAVVYGRTNREEGDYACLVGGTSDGHLLELRIYGKDKFQLRPRGKVFAQPGIMGLVATKQRRPKGDGEGTYNAVFGVAGTPDGMPRSFCFSHGASQSAVRPGGIPRVDGRLSMVGFGALVGDGKGNLWAGERDRIARLVRYPLDEASGGRKPPEERRKPPDRLKSDRPKPSGGLRPPLAEDAPRLPCHVVFAPAGTTTDGSGYTAIEVGKDGKVYVGAARYGDYAWLLRFDPAASPTFMDRVVSMKQLTGERREGISTQGKIHAKIVVAGDGKVWFASKQAHEVFDTRPEYGEDPDGYPGGHLCCFDPKTGFSRSVGILKRQEGLMGGVIDDARGRLYYRSDPKGHLLAYDLKTGDVRDRGHVGSACRYMAIDKHGAVYLAGRGPFLCRYDPETGYVEDLRIKVEGEGGYSSPYVLAIGPNGKLYGVGVTHPSIMEFDIDKLQRGATEVVMRNAAPAAPPGYPVSDIHAAVFGKDGRLYYPLNTTGPVEKGGKPVQHLRLMRFDPALLALPSPPKGGREGRARGARKAETVGVPQVVGLDEEKVKPAYARPGKFRLYVMQGAAVGADGTLFLMGISPQLHVACFPKLTAAK